jgi:hypothetical protein
MNLKNKMFSYFYNISNNKPDYLMFFRVSIALIAIFDILSMKSDFKYFFSKDKNIIPQELLYIFSEYNGLLNPMYKYLTNNNLLDSFYTYTVIIYFISLLFLMIGLCTKVSAFVSIVLQLIIFKSIALLNFGFDHFLTMSLFYCLIFPVGSVNSVDNLIRKNKIEIKINYNKIIRIHLMLVYFFAGLAKIIASSYWNGEAIWRSVSTIYNDMFRLPAIFFIVSGIATVILETFYPFLINYTKTSKITFYVIISMHVFIGFLMELPFFAAIMIVWNITAYYKYIFNEK